jgi:hypothetical protein
MGRARQVSGASFFCVRKLVCIVSGEESRCCVRRGVLINNPISAEVCLL